MGRPKKAADEETKRAKADKAKGYRSEDAVFAVKCHGAIKKVLESNTDGLSSTETAILGHVRDLVDPDTQRSKRRSLVLKIDDLMATLNDPVVDPRDCPVNEGVVGLDGVMPELAGLDDVALEAATTAVDAVASAADATVAAAAAAAAAAINTSQWQ